MSTVIVAGPVVSDVFGGFPYQEWDVPDLGEDTSFLSKEEYGNHLPELWGYFKGLSELRENGGARVNRFAEIAKENKWTVVSYSVNGFLERAGVNVLEAEGNMYRGKCLRCQRTMVIDYASIDHVVKCDTCGKSRVRPDVRLVGEKELGRRLITNAIDSAPRTIFVGVDMDDLFISKLERNSTLSYVVSEEKVAGVNTLLMSVEDWVQADCPVSN